MDGEKRGGRSPGREGGGKGKGEGGVRCKSRLLLPKPTPGCKRTHLANTCQCVCWNLLRGKLLQVPGSSLGSGVDA